MLVNACRDRLLPRRLARWVNGLISKAEKASAFLLIASFYNGQVKTCASLAFEKAAMDLVAAHGTITLKTLTINGIIRRLKTLQYLLHNLDLIARRLGKSIAAHAHVLAIKIDAMQVARNHLMTNHLMTMTATHNLLEDAIPP